MFFQNSDGSDEECFLESLSFKKRKFAWLRKRQRKRRKGDFDISRNLDRNTESVASQNEKRDTQNKNNKAGPSTSRVNKNNKAVPSTSHVNKNNETVKSTSHVNRNNEAVASTSHVHNLYQKKLKQAKLNFQVTKNSHVNPGTSTEPVTPKKYGLRKEVDKVITSTPVRDNVTVLMETGDLDDISAIDSIERNKNKTKQKQ